MRWGNKHTGDLIRGTGVEPHGPGKEQGATNTFPSVHLFKKIICRGKITMICKCSSHIKVNVTYINTVMSH